MKTHLTPEQVKSEERRSKYWLLIGLLRTAEWMREEDPDVNDEDIVNQYLDHKEQEDEAFRGLIEYENLCCERNKRMLKAIKNVKGKTFHKYILQIISDVSLRGEVMSIVSEPEGDYQNEKYGRTIKGIWVDQWSVGMDGDSFDGNMFVQLKEGKFLKIPYSC